jgi:hypothetical protein
MIKYQGRIDFPSCISVLYQKPGIMDLVQVKKMPQTVG